MGPRPRGRGNRTPRTPANPWPRFNGAATARSRKFPRIRPSAHPSPCCFNGAATARSRKFLSRGRWSSRKPTLQWGRDRVVAEIALPGWTRQESGSFNGAATARSRKCGGTPSNGTNQGCFNGAATARSRKFVPSAHSHSVYLPSGFLPSVSCLHPGHNHLLFPNPLIPHNFPAQLARHPHPPHAKLSS